MANLPEWPGGPEGSDLTEVSIQEILDDLYFYSHGSTKPVHVHRFLPIAVSGAFSNKRVEQDLIREDKIRIFTVPGDPLVYSISFTKE